MYRPEEGFGGAPMVGSTSGEAVRGSERYIAEQRPVRSEWSLWKPHQLSIGSSSSSVGEVEGGGDEGK